MAIPMDNFIMVQVLNCKQNLQSPPGNHIFQEQAFLFLGLTFDVKPQIAFFAILFDDIN
jgi:hypothetical protein